MTHGFLCYGCRTVTVTEEKDVKAAADTYHRLDCPVGMAEFLTTKVVPDDYLEVVMDDDHVGLVN